MIFSPFAVGPVFLPGAQLLPGLEPPGAAQQSREHILPESGWRVLGGELSANFGV